MSHHQGGADGVDGLPFVTGAIWHGPRDVTVHVRAREPRKSGGGKSSSDTNADAAAEKLTLQMKMDVHFAAELLYLLDAPEVLTALPKLAAQISMKAKDMIPRELSNSLSALARLKDDACREDVAKLATALVCQIPDKAEGMIPQQLSNSLWAAAQLKDIAPDVKKIVPAIAAQIQVKANGMVPQHISNSLWAATRMKDDAPEVLQMVPALVEEIPRNQADFSSQAICNCLEALVLLRDSVSEVGSFLGAPPNSKNDFAGFASSRFSTLLPRLKGKSLAFQMPVVVWACAKINSYHEELLVSVAQRAKSDGTLQRLTDWSLCAMLWSYDVLDTNARFANFRKALESERVRRGLSDSDVSESQSGYFDWNRAKG